MIRRLTWIALWFATTIATAGPPDAIVGTWLTTDDDGNRDSIVEIFSTDRGYVGAVRWIRYQAYPEGDHMAGLPIVDRENVDPALRTRPVLGLQVLNGFRFDGQLWAGGTVYNVRKGKAYQAVIKMTGPDTLKLRGYVGSPWLGKTVTWNRAPIPSPPPQPVK